MKSTKKNKEVEPFWSDLVQTWFSFHKMFFNCTPSFDGSSPRDLKLIISHLRKRCISSGKNWDEETSKRRLWLFLKESMEINWIKNNFTLSNVNRQKDLVFQRISQKYNTTAQKN